MSRPLPPEFHKAREIAKSKHFHQAEDPESDLRKENFVWEFTEVVEHGRRQKRIVLVDCLAEEEQREQWHDYIASLLHDHGIVEVAGSHWPVSGRARGNVHVMMFTPGKHKIDAALLRWLDKQWVFVMNGGIPIAEEPPPPLSVWERMH